MTVLLCFVGAFLAAPAALGQPKPEPATKKQVGPLPEPQNPQAPTPTKQTSPPPPPATPPPAAPPPPTVQPSPPAPPPVFVAPPAPPAVVSPPPPAAVVQSQSHTERPGAKATKPKTRKRNGVRSKPKPSPVAAVPILRREQASSVDGTLLAGGLALFVLVLADTFLLTQASGLLRGARPG